MQYEIYNPCLTTVPSTEAIDRLVAARLDVDGKFVSWVFPDSADLATSAFGIGKCGPMSLEIYYDDRVTLVSPDFISWNPSIGLIQLNPDNFAPLGLAPYHYKVTMLDYPDRFNWQPFEAEVLACNVESLIVNNASVAPVQMLWGDDSRIRDVTINLDSII